MKNPVFRLVTILSFLMLLFVFGCGQQGEQMEGEKQTEEVTEQGEIPTIVMETLKAKFPKAEIDKWTMEKEGSIILYDIEFNQEGRKFEADIKEDGSIHNWEKAIGMDELPDAAKMAVSGKYPEAKITEIMQITEMKDQSEMLEGYEVVLETAENNEVEVTVAPDGSILEDSAEMHQE
jgi:hypothetical protein